MQVELKRDPQPPVKEVVLTLTPEEAAWLRRMVGMVGGDSSHPIRKLATALYNKLYQIDPRIDAFHHAQLWSDRSRLDVSCEAPR